MIETACCADCGHPEGFHFPSGEGWAETELRLCRVYGMGGDCQCRGFRAIGDHAELHARAEANAWWMRWAPTWLCVAVIRSWKREITKEER